MTIVKALVERGAASEAVKASFGYEDFVGLRGTSWDFVESLSLPSFPSSFFIPKSSSLLLQELRFRVRAMSANGVSAPSEPSETEILLITNPAVQQPPPPPDLLGKGIILFEDSCGHFKALIMDLDGFSMI